MLRGFLLIGSLIGIKGDGPFIWPMPSSMTSDANPTVSFTQPFQFSSTSDNPVILQAIDRYSELCFPHNAEDGIILPHPHSSEEQIRLDALAFSPINRLFISITDDGTPLEFEMDESYTLTVSASNPVATLSSQTVWGALRGIETFSQNIIYNYTSGIYIGWALTVNDMPRFSHRGVLVDTSRHFQPVHILKRVLNAMSFAKFNVLHWHITDTQSQPMELKTYPRFWNGAYTPYERYSVNDMKDVVSFAYERGIRVIPEFDMPGHEASWCVGYPEICPSPTCTQPLNPAVNETWDLITSLIKESVAKQDIFIDNWIHLGGDEVSTKCWTDSPSISKWMADQNYTARQAYGYFVERAIGIAQGEFGLQPINWVEVFNNFNTSLAKNGTVIHVWKAKSDLKAAVEDGFRAILSDSDLWYLDHLQITWDQMYMNEPYQGITDSAAQMRVIGGEACMWGETVDASDIDATIWPRAASVAERLWSPRDVNDTSMALSRLEYFRCLMNTRGVGAAPVNNKEAREAPPGPGSCYVQ